MASRYLHILPVLAALLSAGADWTGFRGPRGSGVSAETGLPTTWTSKENVVWRTKLPGPGTSCPVVIGNKIYLTCYSGYGEVNGKDDDEKNMPKLVRHVVCLARDGGRILWTKDFKPLLPESHFTGAHNTQHGYSSSTIASDGERLYVFFGKSGVYSLDLDGNEIWRQSVGTGTSGWGSSNSPVLYKDLVIVNASIESQALVSLDKATGKEVWRTKGIRESWNTPVLVDVPGGPTELVLNESSAVIGFDPASGKELWRVDGFSGYVCPSVVANKDIVYVVRGGVLAIKAGGRGDVKDSHVLWRTGGNSVVSSPVYYDSRLYWSHDGVECLDATTGKRIDRLRPSKDGNFYASPLAADGKVYCVTRFGGAYVIEAGGPKLRELAHNEFDDDKSCANAGAIAHNGQLLMRTDQYIYCIGKR